jgi:hypothetical protein
MILAAWGMTLTALGILWMVARHQDMTPESAIDFNQDLVHDTLRMAVQGLAQANTDQNAAMREFFREALMTARARDSAEAASAINSFKQTQVEGEAFYNERMAAIQEAAKAHKAFSRANPDEIETPDGILKPL